MNVYGEIVRAQLENLTATPSAALAGRMVWQSTVGKMFVDDGVLIRAMLRNDQNCVFGNNATAANNVRWNRSAAATLQLVTGDDTTAEGSSSSSWAKLNTKLGGSLIDTYADVTETTAPASPAASTRRLYVKADGGLWSKNSGGTETLLAASGLTALALGDLTYGSAVNTFSALAGNTTATRKYLTQTGTGTVSAAPAWDNLHSSELQGTATNDSAAAGYVGEFVSSVVLVGSAVSLTTGTSANVTSISLTAGDWMVSAAIAFNTAGSTTFTQSIAGVSLVSATQPGNIGVATGNENRQQFNYAAGYTPGVTASTMAIPAYRVTIAATTTLYLVARAAFGTSTMTAHGYIEARRVR